MKRRPLDPNEDGSYDLVPAEGFGKWAGPWPWTDGVRGEYDVPRMGGGGRLIPGVDNDRDEFQSHTRY